MSKQVIPRKAIPINTIRTILLNQDNKCANTLDKHAIGLKDYICPKWIYNNGAFDEAGYQADHIVEVSLEGNNNINNIQLLCPCCHTVKTKRYISQNKPIDMPRLNSKDLHNGISYMDLDNNVKKKRKLN